MDTKLNGNATQGVDIPDMTKDDALRMLNRDLPMAIACLQTIHSDADLKDLMAHFLVGRWENYKAKQERE